MEKFILRNKIISTLAGVFLITSCSSITSTPTVSFERNSTVETVDYKTFAWLNETKILSASTEINPDTKVKFDDAIEIAFENQGFQLISDPEKADFTIAYTVSNRDKIKKRLNPVKFQTHTRSSQTISSERANLVRPAYSVVSTDRSLSQYCEGSLSIDVLDVKTHQLAWTGYATKRIYAKDEKNRDQIINDTVNLIVAKFQ